MYNFLRTDKIDALQATYHQSNVEVYQTNCIMRQIYNGFAKQCNVWASFKKLRGLLTDSTRARNLLTQNQMLVLTKGDFELG